MANCKAALEALSRLPHTQMTVVSSIYETEPVCSEGSWFLNGVVGISTGLDPEDLLTRCQQIESGLGRPETRPPAVPRTTDLDILLYGEQILRTPILQVPHPRMHERGFVLIPLSEIAPNAWHPVFQKSISQILGQLKDTHEVKRIGSADLVYIRGRF